VWGRGGEPKVGGLAPTAALPVSAAVSSAVIMYKFLTAEIRP
jgi:hypothetical protein